MLNKHQRAFGLFLDIEDARNALEEMRADDFPMNRVSVISQNSDSPAGKTENRFQDITNSGAIAGGSIGGVLGLALGLTAATAIPVVGPLALLGAAAATFATTLTGGAIGATAGGLAGALGSYGVPERQATAYSDRIHRGEYFIMIDGTEADIRQAEAILSRWNIQELRIYDVVAPRE